jgi:hypothetical protein
MLLGGEKFRASLFSVSRVSQPDRNAVLPEERSGLGRVAESVGNVVVAFVAGAVFDAVFFSKVSNIPQAS